MSAPLELTPSQARAVQARGINVAVVAGAGTGKTRVLVERYLVLLERGIPLRKIVAITFTDKAASEMRDRVRGEIEKRAAQTGAPAFWREHRRDMDDARISTIHALCMRLLRANPVEARLDPRFEVLTEQDAALWQAEALDAVLKDLAERGGAELALFDEYRITQVRETLTELFAQGAAADDAFARLFPSSETADDAGTNSSAQRAALGEWWRARLAQAQARALEKLNASAEWRATATWVQNNAAYDAQDKLEQTRAAAERALELFDLTDVPQTLRALRALTDLKLLGGSAKKWDDLALAKERLKALRALAKEFCDHFDLTFGEADERAAQYLWLWRSLWQRARAAYAARQAREHKLDFNALEEKTVKLLRDPTVRARYAAEFDAVLVDEFQDTNAAQREIVYALAPPQQPERLFIVGDGKQSIYGFRGADVTVFETAQRDLTAQWGAAARVALQESFRTHERLLDAFNFLFQAIFAVDGEPELYQTPFEPLQATRPSARETQMEIIEFPQTIEREGAAEKLAASDLRAWQARELGARLMELVAQQFPVWDKQSRQTRPLQWGDVALLFRYSDSFPIFEDAFKAARLPYQTSAGKGYYDRPEVRDLLHYLRALANPLDDLALAVIFHSPLFALSGETLYRLRRGAETPRHFRDALREIPADISGAERARVEFARAVLEQGWARVGRAPILDLLQHALAATDYLATLSALRDGDRRRGNVEKLLALARSTRVARVGDFNQYIRALTEQNVREGEALLEAENAARLMTIHAAKGLEFPIVVLPDASRAARGRAALLLAERDAGAALQVYDAAHKPVKTVAYQLSQNVQAERERAEEKRLLYVALTRAQEYVIVAGTEDAPAQSYLGQIKQALGAPREFAWGKIQARAPRLPFQEQPAPLPDEQTPHADAAAAFEIPALARPLAAPRVNDLAAFSATGLETLASRPEDFTRRVLEGAPDRVPMATRQTTGAYVPHYIVGDMTHRALRQWRFPHNTPNLDTLLAEYARALDLADDAMIHAGVLQARKLLTRFTQSELFRVMDAAQLRRHEVPFVCEWQGRTVHGSMDALTLTAEGDWFIADFKTDEVRERELRAHALENYAVQLGLYQYAAAQVLNQALPVRVHYVQRGETLELRAEELQEALARAARALRA